MNAFRVSGTVKRSAWWIAPCRASAQRARPGRIGSPAASAEVQVFGRRWFERRLQIAPDPACQLLPPLRGWAAYSSYSLHFARSTTITCLSPSALRPPSIGAFGGIGYGPLSD